MDEAPVNPWPDADLKTLADLVDLHGLDGLLRMIIKACEIKAALVEAAKGDPYRWKQRVYNGRAYARMASRVEGRES